MFIKIYFKANKSAGLLSSLLKPKTINRSGLNREQKTTSVPAGHFLACGTSIQQLSLSKRSYSTKLREFPSAPARSKSEYKGKQEYTNALKAVPEKNIIVAPLAGQAKELFEKLHPISNKEPSKHDWIQGFMKRFPKDAIPKQLLNAFVKKFGYKRESVKPYCHLIHLFALSGDFTRAQSIFDLLKADGLTPNEIAYHALMNAYCNGGELSKTIEMFELLSTDPISKDPHPYALLIKAYMKHNRVRDAFDVLALMKQKMVPNIQVYTTLIQACIKARDNSLAWSVYEMMLKDSVLPDVRTYNMMISICKKDEVNKALELFQELLDRGISPSQEIINSVLSALCSAPGYYPRAKEFLNTFVIQRNFNPDAFTFIIMINGASVSKNLADARSFFFQLLQIKHNSRSQLLSYTSLFKAYSTVFPSDRIERFIKLPAVSKKINDLTFLQYPSPYHINDCVNEAMLMIPFFERIALPKGSNHAHSCLCASFMSILANYNYFNEAMKWLGIFSKKFNQHLHFQFYTCMLEMCTRLHKEEAFFTILGGAEALLAPIGPRSSLSEREKTEYKHANLLSSNSLRSSFQSVILGLSEFNRLSDAMDYFETMNQDPKIDWKKNVVYFKPFFKAVRGSDSKLKLRLDHILA